MSSKSDIVGKRVLHSWQVDGEKSKTLNVPYWGTVLREQKKSANTWYTVLYDVDNRTQVVKREKVLEAIENAQNVVSAPDWDGGQGRAFERGVYVDGAHEWLSVEDAKCLAKSKEMPAVGDVIYVAWRGRSRERNETRTYPATVVEYTPKTADKRAGWAVRFHDGDSTTVDLTKSFWAPFLTAVQVATLGLPEPKKRKAAPPKPKPSAQPTGPADELGALEPPSPPGAPNAKKQRYSKEEPDHLYPHPARHACVGAAAPSAHRRGPLAYGANGSGIVGDQSLRVELIAKPALGRSSSARAAHAPAAGVESQPAAAALEQEDSQCMRAVALTLCKLSEAFGEWAGRSGASSGANVANCVGDAVGIAEEPPRAPVAEVAVVATAGGGERPCAVVTDENTVPPTNIAAAGLGSLDAVGKAHVADTSPYGGGAAQGRLDYAAVIALQNSVFKDTLERLCQLGYVRRADLGIIEAELRSGSDAKRSVSALLKRAGITRLC